MQILRIDLEAPILPEIICTYCSKLETSSTLDICKCLWRFDETDTRSDNERRRVLVQQHPACPIHTKEGLITGFLNYVYEQYQEPLRLTYDDDARN